MARRPNESEHATRELGHRRAPLRLALYATAALAVAVVVGGASPMRAHAASDPAANTVLAVGGAPGYGPSTGMNINANFVGLASMRSGLGYWAVAADGGVFARGQARFYGSMGGHPLTKPIVGIASTPNGDGYWLVASDGGVFAFGRAGFHGSLGGHPINSPIMAIAATRTGKGYWLLGADGGVFTFGDARFNGSAVNRPHRAPFTALATVSSGHGYYLLGADGGVFTFGDAHFSGSAVDGHFATGITALANGRYQIARTDGSVVGFGGAPSYAAPADWTANQHPVIAIAKDGAAGSWLARGYAPLPPPPPKVEQDLSQDPFLKCTRAHESDTAGGYRAVSPDGRYRGAYQFLQSTWDNVARHIGRYDLVGVDPAAASPHDQDVIAMALFQWQGYAPWGNRCMGLT